MPIDTSYIAEFRRRIQDVRHSRRALSVGVTDDGVVRCIAELSRGRLYIQPQGGSAPALDFDLSSSRYDTVGALYQAISRATGYRANLDEDADQDHLSLDLQPFGPLDIKGTGLELVHHTFSDSELIDLITRAIQRHNPTATMDTLPPQEMTFVWPLAHAEVCKVQAYDASKRRGLDKDVQTLLSLAETFEAQYRDDRERNARAIQSPKEANGNVTDEGDVMLGSLSRVSLRTGFQSPIAKSLPPDAAVLLEPSDRDIEDDNVRVQWQRNKNVEFYSYELWMDSTPDVVREREGGLVYAGQPVAYQTTEDSRRNGAQRQTSSIMVFRSFGANSNSARSTFSTFVEEMGQLIRAFAVGELESDTTYYFRLYVIGINFQSVSSQVIAAKTKPLRARFKANDFIDKKSGPAGTVCSVTLDPTKGAFTAQHKLRIGEKTVVPTIVDPYHLTFVVPSFQNTNRPKELVITSPTGLVDVRSQCFQVTT